MHEDEQEFKYFVLLMDGWMDKWMDGWMDGWMDKWMDGWIDGWIVRGPASQKNRGACKSCDT